MRTDDVQVEPIRGLPELPPEGERILWQGAPDPLDAGAAGAEHAAGSRATSALLAAWRGVAIGPRQGWALGAEGDGAVPGHGRSSPARSWR